MITHQAQYKPEGMKQTDWEKEFLNPIAYEELKRQRIADQVIAESYGIRPYVIQKFRKEQGIKTRNWRPIS